jgi:hypothetical protein
MPVRTLKLTLIVVLGALVVLPQAAGAAATSIKWGKPLQLENPAKYGAFDAISCPRSDKTTAAIATPGTTTTTTGTTTTGTATTGTTKISRAGTKTKAAPFKPLCVAGDQTGHIWWSTEPTKRAIYWKRSSIDSVKHASLTGVSCPTTNFCVVVDNKGYVMWSRKPTGGVKHWSKPVQVDTTAAAGGGPAGFAAISCPTVTLCVAVDNVGQVVTSTDPMGGASAWTTAVLPDAPSLTGVSCPSATLCVIVGSTRFYSTTPSAGASAWKVSGTVIGGVLVSIACPSATLCVSVGYGDSTTGLASASATPSGAASGWASTTINTTVPSGNSQLLDSVACAGIGFCVAVDGADNAFDTVSPLTGSWTPITAARALSTSTWSAISCNTKTCVVVDSRGFVTSGSIRGSVTASSAAPTTTTTTTTTTPAA